MAANDGSASTWTSRRSVLHARGTARESRKTVLVALTSNIAVTLAKLAAGVLSGSAAMLAETAHSLADTTNQVFLLISIQLAEREPTPEQPFGYARARFLWTFLAAVAMFLAGAVFAIGYGIYQLTSSVRSSGYTAAYISLAISLAAEGTSWLRALRQTRRESRDAQLSLLRYVRASRDPNVKMVLFEDTAALAGIALAFTGILIDQLTGSAAFDPAASIAIGVLLVSVAALMGHDTSELLIGGAARPAERAALEKALSEFPQIDKVVELLTMVLGPRSLLVAARVDFAPGLDDHELEQASDAIDRRLREVVPDVSEVFLDATTTPTTTEQRSRGGQAGSRSDG